MATKTYPSLSFKMTVLVFTLTFWGTMTLTCGLKLQQKFLEDGELQSTAWEILKTLGGTIETNQSVSVVPNDPEEEPLSGSAISTEIFAFGEQVVSPSSSKQRKLGDLRNLVKQIKEQDDSDTIAASISSGVSGDEKGVMLASISITIILFCVFN